MKNGLKKAIENLEDVMFWLGDLKRFPKFTVVQQSKLDTAFKLVNEVYNNFEEEGILDKLEEDE